MDAWSEPPPKIDSSKLDFSEFHPLDHTLWQCRNYPGGRKTHLSYRWEFQWASGLRRRTLCRIGRHSETQMWKSGNWDPATKTVIKLPAPLTATVCIDCGKRFSEWQTE